LIGVSGPIGALQKHRRSSPRLKVRDRVARVDAVEGKLKPHVHFQYDRTFIYLVDATAVSIPCGQIDLAITKYS
jgi:hypothetical protein